MKIVVPRFVGVVSFAIFLAINLQAQQRIGTAAGGYVNDGNAATNAALSLPQNVAFDSAGNMYISDTVNQRVRKVDASTKIITTFAGTGVAGRRHGDGHPANQAAIRNPRGIVVDSSGNVYFSDSGNQCVRMVDTSGIISTFAGNGTGGYGGDGGPATSAELNQPAGLAIDSTGNIYIADTFNNAIRMVDTSNVIHTVAGNGKQGYSGDGGPATSAEVDHPRGIFVDASGNMFIADTNNRAIREVKSGTINTIAGNGALGCTGDGGAATKASIGNPRDVIVGNGTLYISNGGCDRIRAVTLSSGIITNYAGTDLGYDGEGNPPSSVRFSTPTGLGLDAAGNLLVVDSGNNRVRKVTSTAVNTLAGGYTGDAGPAAHSALNDPQNITFDKHSNMYIVEGNGNRVRKVSAGGKITTFAGTGVTGFTGDGGPATAATLNNPLGVAVDSKSNVYIADNGNNLIRVVKAGTISTFAENTSFSSLASLATDSANNVYAADQNACVIWKITSTGVVSVVAGEVKSCGYNSDGGPATSSLLNAPYGVALDSAGNLYIGDTSNNRIRMVNTTGTISTVAGTGVCGYSGDGGSATAAKICTPLGVKIDPAGNLYIADWRNAVFRVVKSGVITTFAGSGKTGFNNNGELAIHANIDGPAAIAIKPTVNVPFLVDDQQYRVRNVK
jgi:trimeric autotransporter adhesin